MGDAHALDLELHEYFAYGTNMDAARMQARCPGARDRRPACLRGHALYWNKLSVERDGTGYANVEPSVHDAMVEGVLYTISKVDLLRLDRFEGYPAHYTRRLVAIEEPGGTRVPAWVYMATPDWRGTTDMAPHPDHLNLALGGRDLLSDPYVAGLEALLNV